MSDIAKCATDNCPSEKHCYRKTAPSSDWQAWSEFKFTMVNGQFKCEDYIEVKR